jgi:hypothetical protein
MINMRPELPVLMVKLFVYSIPGLFLQNYR